MDHDQLSAAARTVVELGEFLADLKLQALTIYRPDVVAARGYVTPSEEVQLRHLQVSYWKARNALYELLYEIWQDFDRIERATPQAFLIALAAAALLVDAARFLRESFHRPNVIRRKLDEPDAVYGIPPRMYDNVQKSLTSPYHAWHLWRAIRYFDQHRSGLLRTASREGLEPIVALIDRFRERMRPTLWTYLRTRARVRGRRAVRRFGRDVLALALYGVQEAVGRGLAEVRTRPHHSPSLPKPIRAHLATLLRPGDVLIVRKEHAATNYFLPGHWPHAALYLGTTVDLAAIGIDDHPHLASRWARLSAATTDTAVLASNDANAWSGDGVHPCVLEDMKDGVRIRSVNSPFNSDSIVVIRPILDVPQIAAAIAQAFMHEGKPYDFDFDFRASHRLVCTEVVYRAYEGIGGIQFQLQQHVGRFALAAGDLLRMAIASNHFEVVLVYSPPHATAIQFGQSAVEIVRRVERSAAT